MLRRLPKFAAAFLSATVLVAPLPAFAQQPQHHPHKRTERTQIEALEEQWRKAVLAIDIPTMDKLLSDDFLGIQANGEVVTKTQQLEHMRNHQFVIDLLETSDLKIKLINNVAIVTSLAHVSGVIDGDHLQGAYRYTRIYQHLATGAWKVTNFEATPATGMHGPPPPPPPG
jgi:ketosteroid isomerase-like protein